MDYIAVIDYDHLDNGLFLATLAESLSRQKEMRGIFIHGESAYTERLIQTGVMREDAVIRAVKDLNHRLIALFADHGVAAIGLNGYQRSLVRKTGEEISIDTNQFYRFPNTPHLLISNLADTGPDQALLPLDLPAYAAALGSALNIGEVLVFNKDDAAEIIKEELPGELHKEDMNEAFADRHIPSEFSDIPIKIRLTSARALANFPSGKGTTILQPGRE